MPFIWTNEKNDEICTDLITQVHIKRWHRTFLSVTKLFMKNDLKKTKSILVTHIRTKRIGLNACLHFKGVSDLLTLKCHCDRNKQTVKHVLMFCHDCKNLRLNMLRVVKITNYWQISITTCGIKVVTKMLLQTDLLSQFELAKTLLYSEV